MSDFNEIYSKAELTDLVNKLNTIKETDKKMGKRLTAISFISCVSMAILGYFAIGFIGAVIFFIIVYTASFFMTFSTKKRSLLAYLKLYREKLPPLLCEGISKVDKPRYASTLTSLYPNTLNSWTVCYALEDIDTGFVRVIEGGREIASGMAVVSRSGNAEGYALKGYFPALTEEYCEEMLKGDSTTDKVVEFASLLDKHFEAYAIFCGEEYSLLFIPSASDFMTDRVETTSRVDENALKRQTAYFEISKAFEGLDTEALSDALSLFDEVI